MPRPPHLILGELHNLAGHAAHVSVKRDLFVRLLARRVAMTQRTQAKEEPRLQRVRVPGRAV